MNLPWGCGTGTYGSMGASCQRQGQTSETSDEYFHPPDHINPLTFCPNVDMS